MVRFILKSTVLALASFAILGVDNTAQAQAGLRQRNRTPRAVGRPTISPYQFMANNQNSAAFNYVFGTRPAQNYVRDRQAFNEQLGGLQRDLDDLRDDSGQGGASVTGHSVSFMNYRQYFMNLSGVFGGGRGVGGSRAGTAGGMASGIGMPSSQGFSRSGGSFGGLGGLGGVGRSGGMGGGSRMGSRGGSRR